MKKFVVALVGVVWAGTFPVHAADWRLFVVPEFISVSNADDQLVDAVDAIAAQNPGSTTDTNANGALGIRVGLLTSYRPWKNTAIGGSVGWIGGLRVRSIIETASGSQQFTNDQTYIRALAEGLHWIPLNSHVALKLGIGAGVAQGRTRQDNKGTGVFAINNGQVSHSDMGFTGEISPAVVLSLNSSFSLELGLRYMYFPTIKKTDQTLADIAWTPFGIYFGLGF